VLNNHKVIPRIASASFSPESSYLIVGGLGGIGKSIAEWMVRKGVKYLVLLSRRATYEPEVQKFLNKLTEEGCKVKLLSCDVSNSVELETGLEECELEMPPIRGIIQAAMVLKASPTNMKMCR
jgi:short-subunit dehydrogenase